MLVSLGQQRLRGHTGTRPVEPLIVPLPLLRIGKNLVRLQNSTESSRRMGTTTIGMALFRQPSERLMDAIQVFPLGDF